jgi:preprotein translocase subunit SecE
MKIFEATDKFTSFISEVGEELKKSAWPTRPELLESTVMVIVSVVMLAVFVGVCDLILMRLLKIIV